MYKLVVILAVLPLLRGQDLSSGDLDSVIAEIFGKPDPQQKTTSKPSTIVPPITNNNGGGDGGDNTGSKECKMESGETGECVKYYLCNVNNTINTDGIGVIDIRVSGNCESYLDVCCLLPDQRKEDDPITPAPDVQPARQGCGWRNPNGVGFLTTGDKDGEAKFAEFPWMVAVLKIEPVNENDPNGQQLNVYVGGGSLIHPSVVLTAAHYVSGDKTLRVRAGEWDTQTTKEIYPNQDREVKEVVVHKDFNKNNLFYDIALLFLKSPMDLAPNVGVACLPPARERAPHAAPCLASGWGKDKFGKEGRYQVILKKVEVPVVERRQCQESLRRTRLGHFFELHSSFMCAGGQPGKDTCKGDGGSPLVCPIEYQQDRYVQNGIVAWGIGCGEDGTPGVYVDVANLRDWIDDKIAGHGYDPKVYTY
ncbi:phenoloxidase-activating factor 2-like isoform X2 [Aricia agestis]|uniref:phenoloxidase-activating factor 2-like isoform X2 n=1 Tax=Aricia agestis TaxID=91739 RepID=UPI001C201E8A|nr:phenoloxidase-activating factor 2-like isoform X2 [Aricia agestis]